MLSRFQGFKEASREQIKENELWVWFILSKEDLMEGRTYIIVG